MEMQCDKKKVLSFQGLRGFAIILIMLSHCDYVMNDYGNNIFMYFGGLGVQLFIMLSGFLAYYNFIFYDSKSLRLVLKDKLKKIYPLHIITLIVSLPLCITLFTGNEVLKNGVKLILNVLLLNTWIPRMDFYFSFNAVSWYLALVVFFILITPTVVRILEKINNKFFLIVIMVVFVLGEFLWAYVVSGDSMAHWLIYVCPIVRSFDFVNGAIVCKIVKDIEYKNNMVGMGIVGILIGCSGILCSSLNRADEMYLVAFWSIPSVMLIGLLYLGEGDSRIVNIIFKNPILVFIGNISFELFLIHQLVIRYVRGIYGKIVLEKSFLLYALAIVIAVVVSWCYKLSSKQVHISKNN